MPSPAADYPIRPVPFTAVRITGGFWQKRQAVNLATTVPYAIRQCEDTGRLRNFDLAAETLRRRAAGETTFQNKPVTIYPFDDSDVYKVMEGIAYALHVRPDPVLEARLDGWIARVVAAQEPDGYLYTFRTMHPDSPVHEWIDEKRWLKDADLSHEIYNLGHLYEAGVAHFEATGKRTLLDACLRSAELLWRDFGDRRLRVAPGHQVIEMGLAKLHRVTGDARWIELAKIFLAARGPGGKAYSQQHLPVTQQTEAVGHAVRANYMYAGMADVAALTGNADYVAAIRKIWDNVAEKKLSLTGGVGPLQHGEAYGADYELPNACYNETCAAIALMMWNQRMFLFTGEARYHDVLERTAHNGFISGVSLSGDRFFYPNPLAYDGVAKNNHDHAGRAPWFGCACCPPNLMRTLAALTGWFYAVRDNSIYVNFYAPNEGEANVAGVEVRLTQATDYPWSGTIRLTVTPEKPAAFTVRLRIPGWAQGRPVPSDLYTYADAAHPAWSLRVAGEPVAAALENGYAVLTRTWQPGDVVELELPMPVHKVRGHPRIEAVRRRLAFERGPVVYAFEDAAGQTNPEAITVSCATRAGAHAQPGLLGDVVTLVLEDVAAPKPVALIPYCTWNNRGLAPMAVWLPETVD
ncbi:MAG: glycoside hydrolase family 127 protein [Opitutaceae bacterium]|nr:glycoside hydrolase family 127 protein [Opitutaceae bacterium]